MSLAENLQREDLSAIEETWGITKLVDIQLHNTCEEYKEICQKHYIGCNTKGEFLWDDDSCRERVKFILRKADSDRRHNTNYLAHNIVGQIENAFQLINKGVTWRSFYNHRLPDIINIDQEVQEVAINKKLNASQTKALNRLKKANRDEFKKVVREGIGLWETNAEGKSTKMLYHQSHVSRTFENSQRLEFLTWYHHLIASYSDNPLYWIHQAHDNLWSTRELAGEIKKAQKLLEIERLKEAVKDIKIEGLILGDTVEELKKLSAKSVHLVVTDPPWGVDYVPSRQGEALSFNELEKFLYK